MIINSLNHSFSSEDFESFLKSYQNQYNFDSVSLDNDQLDLAQSIVKQLDNTQNLIIVSYGSSHLFIKNLIQFAPEKKVNFLFINHLDYKQIQKQLLHISDQKNSVLFFSKSGETKEIFQMASFLHKEFSFEKFIFTSSNLNSSLNKFTQSEGFPFFYFPSDLPNRFNLLSPIHLICILIFKIDLSLIQKNYSAYDINTQLAPILHLHRLKGFSNLCLSYDSKPQKGLIEYLCNIWNESLGNSCFPIFAQPLYIPEFFHSSIEYYANSDSSYYLNLSYKDLNSYYQTLFTHFLKETNKPYSNIRIEDNISSSLILTKLFHQVIFELGSLSQGKAMEQNIVDKWKALSGPI